MPAAGLTGGTRTAGATTSNAKAMLIAFILTVSGAGGFTLLPVTLPALATAFQLSPGQVGTVSTLELVGVTLGALITGLFARRLPTRPFAIVVMVVLLSCTLGTMLVSDIWVLASLRLVDGLGGGAALGLAYSILSVTKRPDRNLALNAIWPLVYGAIGFAVIPAFENAVSWHASFIVLAVTHGVALIAALFANLPLRHSSEHLSFRHSLPNLRGLLALVSVVLYYAGLVAIYSFSFTMGIVMTGDEALTGNVLSLSQIVGIAGCLIAAVAAGRIHRRIAIVSGFAVTLVGVGFLMWVDGGTAAYIIGLFAINFAWNFLAGSHIAAVGTLDERGSAAAFLAVAINGGAAIGPLLGFTVIDESYLVLELVAFGMIAIALVFILVAIRGRSAIATGGPVLADEVESVETS